MSSLWSSIIHVVRDSGLLNFVLPNFDIFGTYYVLDPTASDDEKYTKLTAEKAKAQMTLQPESVIDIYNAHLVNVSTSIKSCVAVRVNYIIDQLLHLSIIASIIISKLISVCVINLFLHAFTCSIDSKDMTTKLESV